MYSRDLLRQRMCMYNLLVFVPNGVSKHLVAAEQLW